jgi:hypothetical protein
MSRLMVVLLVLAGLSVTLPLVAGDNSSSKVTVLQPAEPLPTPLVLTFRIKGVDAIPPLVMNVAGSRFGMDVNVDQAAKSGRVNFTGELRPTAAQSKTLLMTYDVKVSLTNDEGKGGDVHVFSTVIIEPGKTTKLAGIDQGELTVDVAELK